MAPIEPWDRDRVDRDLSQLKELVMRKQSMRLLAVDPAKKQQLDTEIQAHKEAIAELNAWIRANA